MLRRLIPAAASLLLILSLAACNSNTAAGNTDNTGDTVTGSTDNTGSGSEESGGGTDGTGDGNAPEAVVGKVTAIDGSSITIDIINTMAGGGGPGEPGGDGEFPQQGGGRDGQEPDGEGGSPTAAPSGGDAEAQPEKTPGQMPEGTPDGERPQNGGGFSGFETSGETTTVTVDADTVITLQSSDGDTAGTVSDIAVDDIISVTMSGETAVSVTVMNSGAMPGAPGDNNGGPPAEGTPTPDSEA